MIRIERPVSRQDHESATVQNAPASSHEETGLIPYHEYLRDLTQILTSRISETIVPQYRYSRAN